MVALWFFYAPILAILEIMVFILGRGLIFGFVMVFMPRFWPLWFYFGFATSALWPHFGFYGPGNVYRDMPWHVAHHSESTLFLLCAEFQSTLHTVTVAH